MKSAFPLFYILAVTETVRTAVNLRLNVSIDTMPFSAMWHLSFPFCVFQVRPSTAKNPPRGHPWHLYFRVLPSVNPVKLTNREIRSMRIYLSTYLPIMDAYHIYDSVYSHVRCAFTQNARRIKAELRSACSGVVSIIHVSAVFLISPDYYLRPAKSAFRI